MPLSHDELHTAIAQFRNERIHTVACNADQHRELKKLTLTPPSDLVVCKDGSRSLVGKHTLTDGTQCVLKYYYPKNLAKKINYGLRGSRCMRSWIAAKVFSRLGIPTAAPMMIHEQKGASGMTIKQSFLACHLAQGIPLSDITDEETLQHVASQLDNAFTIMANYHISHGDLKANNIIVDKENRIRFIDLDGTTILTSPTKWTALWNRDRARFLRNWQTESPAYQILADTIQPA